MVRASTILRYAVVICGLCILAFFTKILEYHTGTSSRNSALQFMDFSHNNRDMQTQLSAPVGIHSGLDGDGDDNSRQIIDLDELQPNNLDFVEDLPEEREDELSSRQKKKRSIDLPTIFAITPTYQRFLQKAELTRVANTFLHVPNFHWIVVEDSNVKTQLVANTLDETGLVYTHLNIRTPRVLRRSKSKPRWTKSRGLEQRNKALDWLRENVNPHTTSGVVYFADDDNTYDIRLFEEMRHVQGVGIWPVAFTGAARFAGPVCKDGHVIGFHNNWKPWRSFPIDMAGFAINLKKLLTEYPEVRFRADIKPGFLETTFLEQLTTVEELEPRAQNCSKVYVWHTRTENPIVNINGEKQLIRSGRPSNPDIET